MNCDRDVLEAIADGAQPATPHVESCSSCAEELRRLRVFNDELRRGIRAIGDAIPVPPAVVPKHRLPWLWAAAAAAMLLAAGVTLWPTNDLGRLADRVNALSPDDPAFAPAAAYLASLDPSYGNVIRASRSPAPDDTVVVEARRTSSKGGVETTFHFLQRADGRVEVTWEQTGPDGTERESLRAASWKELDRFNGDVCRRLRVVSEQGELLVGLPFGNGHDPLEGVYAARLARHVSSRDEFDRGIASFRRDVLAVEGAGRLEAFLDRWQQFSR